MFKFCAIHSYLHREQRFAEMFQIDVTTNRPQCLLSLCLGKTPNLGELGNYLNSILKYIIVHINKQTTISKIVFLSDWSRNSLDYEPQRFSIVFA
jgi:hypothetical protein